MKTLEEVKPQILATLTRDSEAQQEAAFAQQLAAEAAKTGLAAAAAAHHLQVTTSDYVEQSATLPGLADSSKLLTAAFAAKQGGAPQEASTGDGFAVFTVDGITAAHAPTFEEYKSHLLDDFREQQMPQLLARKTNELADKAHAEGSLDQAAKEVGATVKTSDLVDRTAQVPDIGDLGATAPELFDSPGPDEQSRQHRPGRESSRRSSTSRSLPPRDRQEFRCHPRAAPDRQAELDV